MHPCPEIVVLTADLIRVPSMHSRLDEIMRCADFIADLHGRLTSLVMELESGGIS
jgi:hypothetical protein